MITTSEIMFPKFREDRAEYLRSRQQWSDLFDAVVKTGDRAGWDDWLRDPFFEGTPIFSRVNRREKKGIVVNQILPADDDLEFRAYLDVFASDSDTDLVEHLVITSTLTEAAKSKAAKLVRAYLAGGKPAPGVMARLCEQLTGDAADRRGARSPN
jgi:hypothetical protein